MLKMRIDAMIRIYLHAKRGIWKSIDTKLAEWMGGLLLLCWGITLFLVDGIFDRPSYSGFSALMGQTAFAYTCFGIGLTRIIILAVNGGFSRSPHLRTAISLISGVFMVQMAVAFNQSDVSPTGLITYIILAINDFAAMLRAARDARQYDDNLLRK